MQDDEIEIQQKRTHFDRSKSTLCTNIISRMQKRQAPHNKAYAKQKYGFFRVGASKSKRAWKEERIERDSKCHGMDDEQRWILSSVLAFYALFRVFIVVVKPHSHHVHCSVDVFIIIAVLFSILFFSPAIRRLCIILIVSFLSSIKFFPSSSRLFISIAYRLCNIWFMFRKQCSHLCLYVAFSVCSFISIVSNIRYAIYL